MLSTTHQKKQITNDMSVFNLAAKGTGAIWPSSIVIHQYFAPGQSQRSSQRLASYKAAGEP